MAHHAKRHFSKNGCAAYLLSEKYVKVTVNRQELLELALKWIGAKTGKSIEQYMADHQRDTNASELWLYFQSVINWVQTIFPHYRREMKGLPWGPIYNAYKDVPLDTKKLNKEVDRLMADEDVTKKPGIYQYVLDRKESHLQIREFTPRDIRTAYEKQKGICPKCGQHFAIEEMQADHFTPWSKGARPFQKTARCFVQIVTEGSRIYKGNYLSSE